MAVTVDRGNLHRLVDLLDKRDLDAAWRMLRELADQSAVVPYLRKGEVAIARTAGYFAGRSASGSPLSSQGGGVVLIYR